MTNFSFSSADRDPPEESGPRIRLTASSEMVSYTDTVVVERNSSPPSEESFYSKWRKIRDDALSTVELHARHESNISNETPNVNDAVNDVDIRRQLAHLEFKFSQSSIRENVTSSVIPIAFSNNFCDKPMESPSSISKSTSNMIFAGALDKMNSLDDYLHLIEVSHNRQQLSLSPTASARRQRYKEQLIQEKVTT